MQKTTKPSMLLYNIKGTPEEKKITLLCLKHKIRARAIEASKYNQPIYTLLQTTSQDNQGDSTEVTGSEESVTLSEQMVIFHGFHNQLFNQVLRDLRVSNIRIPLKAVATPHNLSWNSYQLYTELQEEHQKFQELEKQQDAEKQQETE